jgi:hypothetical protein
MKLIFTISFLVTLLLTAGTALSYDCYERNPPKIRPYACSQCQKPQCRQQHQPDPTRYGQCDKSNNCRMHKPSCKKQVVHQHSYQCKTTCTKKTEPITTVQCRSCGQIHSRDVQHRCGMVQCRTCGQAYQQNIEHRCSTVQCRTCGVHHPQGMRHRCGEDEVRSQHQDCSQGDCFQGQKNGNACRYEGKHKQCATRGCNLTHKASQESRETMETRWHAWFKAQAREEAVYTSY